MIRGQMTMRKKLLSLPILIVLTISLLTAFSLNPATVSAGDYPSIHVYPPSIIDAGLTPGKNFTVSIKTDYTGSDITGYQFTLSYNPSIIHGVSVTNGDLIVGGTAVFLPGTFDNVTGKLSLTGAFFFFIDPPPATAEGPGTLASVTFEVVGLGDSPITLGIETKLIGWNGEKEYDIINAKTMPFHIQHGYFRNLVVSHDVAVIDVTASPTYVTQGDIVDVTVDVQNQGTASETFDVTAYYGPHAIETKTVTNLAGGANATLNYTWDTSVVAISTYTMSAVADTVAGENDTADNTYVNGQVAVNPAVVAVIDAPGKGFTWEDITYDGTGSYAVGATIVAWNWTFDATPWNASGDIVQQMYKWPGGYGTLLQVEDSLGRLSVPAYHIIEITDPDVYEAALVKWKAKPEAHHWDYSKDVATDDGLISLTALARNTGDQTINVTIDFAVLDIKGGTTLHTEIVAMTLNVSGTDVPVTVYIDPTDIGYTGTKIVRFPYVTLTIDTDGDGTPDTIATTKVTRFAVVP